MSIFELFSASVLAVILFWAAYHAYILFVGMRSKFEHLHDQVNELPKFSLIVPAKDEAIVISRCLNALLGVDYPREKMEIIVVDGNSKDATSTICSEFSAKYPTIIKTICESTSRGKPTALNLALPHLTGEIVGVFDADSVPEKGTLRKIASYFNDQSVMAVQGKACSLNEKKNMLTRIASMEEKAWFQALLTGREKLNLFVPLTGSCQFVRSKVLKELGGWDETALAEDVELALRLVEKDYLVKYAPDVCSWQETPSGLGDLIRQRGRWYRGYMEAALKYGRLLDRINKKTIDAELTLVGPYMMVLCLISYVNWAVSVLFFPQISLLSNFAAIVVALTTVSLLSVGTALIFGDKPARVRNVLWIPFVYLYWIMQIGIAGWAFLQILFRRRRIWRKTVKKGFTTSTFA
jgi:cellulose synthase/poly-beta-1,6-N-acetylglucosamine synthase-like glycosyltransferase